MAFTNDVKPLIVSDVIWSAILTTWATENRTWAEYGIYATYTNDSKPS